jgi:hypothetical protein
MKRLWFVVMLGCACPAKPATTPTGSGSGSGSAVGPVGPAPTTCEGARPKVEALYRAEAQTKEPKRVEEAVADNTAMVMTDCAKQPDKTLACLGRVTTVAELEKECLIPLDPEGTEGER